MRKEGDKGDEGPAFNNVCDIKLNGLSLVLVILCSTFYPFVLSLVAFCTIYIDCFTNKCILLLTFTYLILSSKAQLSHYSLSIVSTKYPPTAVKRLMREAQEMSEATSDYSAAPLEENLFEWHFTVRGPDDSEFQVRSLLLLTI